MESFAAGVAVAPDSECAAPRPLPPYALWEAADPAPLVVDSPHSGRDLPTDFDPAPDPSVVRQTEDAYVDHLFAEAPAHGAALLVARFSRAYIDVNRATDEIDPALLSEPWPSPVRTTEKTRLGVGLIRRLVADGIPVYARKLSAAEVWRRIETCWRPYRAALANVLAGRAARFGGAIYLDAHSMKSVANGCTPDPPGTRRPDFVLGDLRGTACGGWLTDHLEHALVARGYAVAVNWPYAGADLVRSFADPGRGIHAIQLEVNRRLYLDEPRCELAPGASRVARDLADVVAGLARLARERFRGP